MVAVPLVRIGGGWGELKGGKKKKKKCFQVFKNTPGSQLLSDMQTFFIFKTFLVPSFCLDIQTFFDSVQTFSAIYSPLIFTVDRIRICSLLGVAKK